MKIEAALASELVADFRTRQELKGKSWESDGDLLAHLISWSEKRLPLPLMGDKRSRKTDAQIRKDERERTQAELAKETPQEKERWDVATALDNWKRIKNSGDPEEVEARAKEYWKRRKAYEAKYGELQAS